MKFLKDFCKDDVKYVELKDICEIKRGRIISKEDIQNEGIYPVYSSQTVNNGELGKINTYDFDGEYITWTTDGANAGTAFYRTGKFSVTNVCGLININNPEVDIKYVYYYLNKVMKSYVSSGMGNPKLMSNVVQKIEISLPPLEVQKKISNTLDKLTKYATELQTELQTELRLRIKQYEYYRDKLLTFGDDIPKVKLKEVVNISIGTKPDEILEYGDYKYINAGTTNSGYTNKFNTEANYVTTPSRGQGGIGFIGYQKERFWCGPLSYKIKEKNFEKLNTKYIYYILTSMKNDILNLKKVGSIPAINSSDLLELKIPLPPLEKQQEIVDILDKFDTLCNSLTEGLPYEIKLRQKQYEYYRDKLLSFDF